MLCRFRTLIASSAVVACIAAAGLWPSDDPQLTTNDAIIAAGTSALSRSVAHAFPIAEAGFAARRPLAGGR